MRRFLAISLSLGMAAGCAFNQASLQDMTPEQAQEKLAQYRILVQEQPESADAHLKLAYAHAALGEWQDALYRSAEALKRNPQLPEAYFLRARMFAELGQNENRLRSYLRILEITEDDKTVGRVAEVLGTPFSITALEVGQGNNMHALLLPDSSKLLWQSDREGDWNIYLAQADGTLPQILTLDRGNDTFPVSSPDGRYVAYVHADEDELQKLPDEQQRDIMLLDLLTKTCRTIANGAQDNWMPAFLADTTSLVFVSDRSLDSAQQAHKASSRLFRYSMRDSSLQVLSGDSLVATSPSGMPDGRLAWVAIKDGEYSIRIGIPGQKGAEIFSGPEPKSGLSASPDGKRLAFFMKKSGNLDIYELNLQTREVTRLTADPAEDFYPRYTPDGQRLLFSSDRYGRYGLFVVHLAQPIARDELVRRIQKISGTRLSESNWNP